MAPNHTAGLDTIFIQIYMDAPPGVPGVSKNLQKYATNKSFWVLGSQNIKNRVFRFKVISSSSSVLSQHKEDLTNIKNLTQ